MSRHGPWPESLKFKTSERILLIRFDDGAEYRLPYELLRIESPSAEVQGHGPGQKKILKGKSGISIVKADRVGQYAVRLHFDDGHSSGIYSWSYLRQLAEHPMASA